MPQLTEALKRKIESVISANNGLSARNSNLPTVSFVSSFKHATELADKNGVSLLCLNKDHFDGDRQDGQLLFQLLGKGARSREIDRILNRICRCGPESIKVHYGVKGGEVATRGNQIQIYVEILWDHFNEQNYLFECRERLMAE